MPSTFSLAHFAFSAFGTLSIKVSVPVMLFACGGCDLSGVFVYYFLGHILSIISSTLCSFLSPSSKTNCLIYLVLSSGKIPIP